MNPAPGEPDAPGEPGDPDAPGEPDEPGEPDARGEPDEHEPGATPPPPALLEIGRIGRPHGVRGDLFVDLSTDRTERLDAGAVVYARGRPLTVARSRAQGRRWVVTFEEVADRATAERLTSSPISAPPIVDPDALWVHELIGSTVVETDGTGRGTCVAVVDNPADDLLELDSGALVPVRFVVSSAGGVVTIDPPDGLFD